ncbi:fatty acid desaturase [Neobacillus sp. D3-1R]|uniref:fatty acid desaturase n=1 Tax=Neobacillus sp. D3-1R TaxID=3445778 RepID=UPI003FA0F288
MSNTQNQIRELKKNVSPFEKTDTRASVIQILNTILPFFVLWFLAYKSLSVSLFLTIPILIVASGLLVRIFIIFHDCCHSSFFKNSKANDILGTITGILTVVPYRQWKHSHSVHHATSSNLDKRGTGDMWLLTVDEYVAAPLWKKVYYRIYRNPVVMFGIGPIAVFLLQYRFNRKGAKRKERVNTYITNFFIVLISAIMCYSIGWQSFLIIQGSVFFLSGVMGIWLFYVQHQFEDSYFEHEEEWSYVQAAVEGSSFYKLPKVLQWITGSIGYHHVHHLAPRVPNYNLEKAHNETLPLQKATTITLKTSLKSLKFKVWDEKTKTFLSFKEMKRSLKQEDARVSPVKMNLKAAKNPKLAE